MRKYLTSALWTYWSKANDYKNINPMEPTSELKSRIARITTSPYPTTAHNQEIIRAALRELHARTGEVLVNGVFVKPDHPKTTEIYSSCGV